MDRIGLRRRGGTGMERPEDAQHAGAAAGSGSDSAPDGLSTFPDKTVSQLQL